VGRIIGFGFALRECDGAEMGGRIRYRVRRIIGFRFALNGCSLDEKGRQ
jgi:hypothetical protein